MAHKFRKFSRLTLFGKRWFWRFRHQNANIMATGAEGYNSKQARDDSLNSFIDIVQRGDFVIEDLDA